MVGFLLRILICVIVWIVYRRRRKHVDKRTRREIWIVTCVTTVIFLFIWIYPIENWFGSFSSPESLFKYMYDGEIQCVLEGEDSAMIISQEDSEQANISTVAEKAESGWKIPTSLTLKVVDQMRSDHVHVIVQRYKKTQDYYITVCGAFQKEFHVSDNRNSNFIRVKGKESGTDYCYAYIKDYDKSYQLKINGKNI